MTLLLGIDPGLAALGAALVRRDGPRLVCVAATTLRTSPRGGQTGGTDERIACLVGALVTWVEASAEPPAALAIEDQSRAWQGQAQRGRTSYAAQLVQRVQGEVTGWARARGLEVVVVQPQEARRAVGVSGRGRDKAAVARGVRLLVEGVPARASEHAVDAVAVAVGGLRRREGEGRRRGLGGSLGGSRGDRAAWSQEGKGGAK